jgi:hypothetical protein
MRRLDGLCDVALLAPGLSRVSLWASCDVWFPVWLTELGGQIKRTRDTCKGRRIWSELCNNVVVEHIVTGSCLMQPIH